MLQHFSDDYLAAAGFFVNDREGLFEIRLSGRTIGRLRENLGFIVVKRQPLFMHLNHVHKACTRHHVQSNRRIENCTSH
jgi:hypothetical protein